MKKDELAILEVGMYVRFKDKRGSHYIRKITSVNNEYPGKLYAGIYIDKTANNCNGVSLKNIINASHKLIDLIEVGDYVNGYKIDYINLKCETPFLRSNQPYRVDNTLYSTLIEKGKDYNQPLHFYEEDIKSIVTKEQFNSMKYEVGE